jgi:hypothetical protein
MLILPPGHAEAIRTRRRLTARERWLTGGVGGILVALVIALAISLSNSGPSSSRGCIYLTIAAATGAQQISQCGPTARATCGSAAVPGSFANQAGPGLIAACRKAGLPVTR